MPQNAPRESMTRSSATLAALEAAAPPAVSASLTAR
jgi:hypothetical protein